MGRHNAKRPFDPVPAGVLSYLSRYRTHRVAISTATGRFDDVGGFLWKNSVDKGPRATTMTAHCLRSFMPVSCCNVCPAAFIASRPYGLTPMPVSRKHSGAGSRAPNQSYPKRLEPHHR